MLGFPVLKWFDMENKMVDSYYVKHVEGDELIFNQFGIDRYGVVDGVDVEYYNSCGVWLIVYYINIGTEWFNVVETEVVCNVTKLHLFVSDMVSL